MRAPRLLLFIGTPLVLALTVYAVSGLLFPTPSDMPRIPSGSGTFANALMQVIGVSNSEDLRNPTGTVQNTERIGGIEASRYVKLGTGCSDPLKPVWVGVDGTGTPICGSRSPGSLVLAKISEKGGNITIYQSSGTIVPGIIGMSLSAGDVVVTDASGTGTIEFSDNSIIRLSTNTTVELSPPAGPGTIAEVILASGDLWGRILASTGSYGIGDGSIVAAVRGTSIALSKGGTISKPTYNEGSWKYARSPNTPTLTVVDSTSTSISATVTCPGGYPQGSTELSPYEKGGNNVIQGCTGGSKKSPAELYTESAWIRENTRRDIVYMSGITPNNPKARAELVVTLPTPEEYDPICIRYNGQDDGTWYPAENRCVFGYADYTEGSELHLAKTREIPNGTVASEKKIVGVLTGVWLNDDGYFFGYGCSYGLPNGIQRPSPWSASYNLDWLGDKLFENPMKSSHEYFSRVFSGVAIPAGTEKALVNLGVDACYDSRNIYQDRFKYNKVTFYGSDPTYTPTPGVGASITQNGQYIEYKGNWIGKLGGKRVRMELKNIPTNTQASQYLLDLDELKYYFSSGNLYQRKELADGNANLASLMDIGQNSYFTITTPKDMNLSRFIIGNSLSLDLKKPLNNSMNNIVIE